MSGDQRGGEQKKKRIAVIGVSSIMLVAMVVAVVVGVKDTRAKNNPTDNGAGHNNGGEISSSARTVNSMCQQTGYQGVCRETLNRANSSDPKVLIQTSFEAAMKEIEGILKKSSTIKAAKEDPRTSGALETCREVMDYAIGDLKLSVSQMGEFDMNKLEAYVQNIRTWLSGAVTYQDACIDAFQNTTGDAGEKMKKLLNVSQELTSNGLALATGFSSVLQSLDIHGLGDIGRLLSENKEGAKQVENDELPNWVGMTKRQLVETPGAAVKSDVVVAKDGSGKYKTISEALKDVPVSDPNKAAAAATNPDQKPFVIYIKEGVYDEQVRVEQNMAHVMFVGDGPSKTVITGKKSFFDGLVVYQTATLSVMGNNFIAKDIGIQNTAGVNKGSAVALKAQSDMSIFYNCKIDGFKSTLLALSHRQFYRDCTISGTIDFLFGDAAAVFQNTKFIIRKPLDDQECYIVAQGKTDEKAATGFVLQNCTIVGDPLYQKVKATNPAFLGRPAKAYSRTIVMQSSIDDSIAPQGWAPWMGNFGIDTCFFVEHENRGPGADTTKRVKWPGIKKISAQELEGFTAGKFIGGESWIVPTKVPFESGMIRV